MREMTRQDDDGSVVTILEGSGSTCPLCLITVQGDPDVVEAHVDSCLAHAVHLQDEQTRASNDDAAWDEDNPYGPAIMRVTDGANLASKYLSLT